MDAYAEDHLVEQPANRLMQRALGWEGVYCYDEWNGGVSNQKRDGQRGVVLVSRLRPALQRLNPDLPVEAIEGAVGNHPHFLILVRPIHFFDSTIAGTTVAHLGVSHFKTIELASQPEDLIRKASDLLEPLGQEQLDLRCCNQTLLRIRDLLLFKLLKIDG